MKQKPKKVMGRPRLPDEIARRELLAVKVTAADKKAWADACKILGTSVCIGAALSAVQELMKSHKN